jgi:hypothetical protein
MFFKTISLLGVKSSNAPGKFSGEDFRARLLVLAIWLHYISDLRFLSAICHHARKLFLLKRLIFLGSAYNLIEHSIIIKLTL